jgi:hypothetical protein
VCDRKVQSRGQREGAVERRDGRLQARGRWISNLRSRSEVPVLTQRGIKRKKGRPRAGPTRGGRELAEKRKTATVGEMPTGQKKTWRAHKKTEDAYPMR